MVSTWGTLKATSKIKLKNLDYIIQIKTWAQPFRLKIIW